MINAGDTIVNPVTGERIVFHKTSASTGGECVEIEVFVQPGGVVAAAHVHPYQTERFEILGGTIGMKVGRKKIEARYGDVLTVEPGTAHKFWNAGDDELHFVCVVSPRSPVRAAARDDVRARRRRQDEPEGDAEPAAARRHRAGRTSTPSGSRSSRPGCSGRRWRPEPRSAGSSGYEATYTPAGGVPALA